MTHGRRRGPDAEARSGSGPPRDALERYAAELFHEEEPLLAEVRSEMEKRGFPMIQVPARTGLFLRILVAATGARRVLEVGTLGGYSTLWIAGGMPPGGTVLTIEKNREHAALAGEVVERAGLSQTVEVRQGVAAEVLPEVGPAGSFDLVFLDADKESYLLYLEHAARLLRPGGLLLADNAFWSGRVLEAEPEDASTVGIKAFNRALAEAEAFQATIVPVGDGVALAVRRPTAKRG